MRCPLAVWRPISTNYGGPMGPINGLCLHVQEGNGSLFGWFNNPKAQVSAHLWLSKAGTMEQYLEIEDQTAWAQAAGNPNYISVETEGFVSEPLTGSQLFALSRLLQWCHYVYNVPMVGPVAHGARGFTQHCNPNGTPDPAWGNHSCPGTLRLAQMPDVIALANNTPPEEAPEVELYTTNSTGTGFIVAADLSSKRGVPSAEDAKNLIATGLYKVVTLDDTLINGIPTTT